MFILSFSPLESINFFQVPKALEIAHTKAKKRNLNIQFELVNLLSDLSLTNLKKHSYDTILDSAVFHVFSDEDRLRYIKNLGYLIKPGGFIHPIMF
jgi:2-polyprenyl-3-methyl-5-hydroxy-6-metoxy-1,4-benzoquinol methylase